MAQTLYAGDNPTPTSLTSEETYVRQTMQALKAELATLETRKKSIGLVLEDAQKSCSHRAFYDVAGFTYDIRTCGICDGTLGLI